MQKLHFPLPQLRIENRDGRLTVWDEPRKKWVLLTPEEWVRQHLMHFLNSQCNCPFSLMSVEKTHRFNGMNRRSDLVLFNNESKALLLAECKAPDVPLKQNAFDQVARYNLILGVPFILVTNGITTYCGRVDRAQESFIYLNDIPSYQHMCGFV